MGYDRTISSEFMHDLQSGMLASLLVSVHEDDTLMLAIRSGYINIYYRGGSLFKISERYDPPNHSPGSRLFYQAEFDREYNTANTACHLNFPYKIANAENALALVRSIPTLKHMMDRHFAKRNRAEREFQQLVARENNSSPISNETDYFIVDIEIAGILPNAKFDMLAVRWLSHEHGRPGRLVPVLIEMKYGIHAFDGPAGLAKHLDDAYSLDPKSESWGNLVTGLEAQLKQIDSLGLLKFNRGLHVESLSVDKTAKPELILLLANYNPRSVKLLQFLNSVDKMKSERSGFELSFFASCFAGYGMHRESMLNLEQFRNEVSRLHFLATKKG